MFIVVVGRHLAGKREGVELLKALERCDRARMPNGRREEAGS